jgi:hypothetical protein
VEYELSEGELLHFLLETLGIYTFSEVPEHSVVPLFTYFLATEMKHSLALVCIALHRFAQVCTGLHRFAQVCTGLRSLAQVYSIAEQEMKAMICNESPIIVLK